MSKLLPSQIIPINCQARTDATKALHFDYDGQVQLDFFWYRDQWACEARRWAERLGYAQAKKLVEKIRGEWADEFIDGTDYHLIKGEELRQLRELVPDSGISPQAPSVLLLTKEGVYGAVLKSNMPKAKLVRRWLRSVVFPALERDGYYALDQAANKPAVEADPVVLQLETAITELESEPASPVRTALRLELAEHLSGRDFGRYREYLLGGENGEAPTDHDDADVHALGYGLLERAVEVLRGYLKHHGRSSWNALRYGTGVRNYLLKAGVAHMLANGELNRAAQPDIELSPSSGAA